MPDDVEPMRPLFLTGSTSKTLEAALESYLDSVAVVGMGRHREDATMLLRQIDKMVFEKAKRVTNINGTSIGLME